VIIVSVLSSSYDPNYDVMYLKFSDGKIIDASTLTKANPLYEIMIKIQDKAEA
jgi:uncharacterized protein YuzE